MWPTRRRHWYYWYPPAEPHGLVLIGSDPSPSMRHHYSVPSESVLAGKISTACCSCCQWECRRQIPRQLLPVGLMVSSFIFSLARKVRAGPSTNSAKATQINLSTLASERVESSRVESEQASDQPRKSSLACLHNNNAGKRYLDLGTGSILVLASSTTSRHACCTMLHVRTTYTYLGTCSSY